MIFTEITNRNTSKADPAVFKPIATSYQSPDLAYRPAIPRGKSRYSVRRKNGALTCNFEIQSLSS